MERFENKVAVVTGASAGIGAACVLDLVKAGMFVVALARREGPLNDLKLGLPEHLQFKMFQKKCDVTVEKEVSSVFKWTINHLGPVHVLVCSAGVLKLTQLSGTIDTYKIRDTVETNIMGVTYCVREAYQQMKAHNIDGHVILINSVSGHKVPVVPCSTINIYPASKHALTAMTESYRQEFSNDGTNVKVSSVSPGSVNTEMLPEELKQIEGFPMLQAEDVSNAVLYCLSTGKNVQVHDMIIKPLHEKL